ncbi:uncharacterized protein LAESUDRAFT_683666 [Laetiporus sulphureus 93-53]|uniref:BTB domain-containing protein n=1 Tax=Laetiporus sulphureus 93-53 TaxID=1314785 RepID=A0A165CVA4_9APHY|nr:uncharacterized protein LAESUDRAFT_683666 [Laetiporus sulphureus 93-53]KZT03492.1 hypothetical protein LAESUDRAFT_683666 [Laetiporus sulphureus 93-53]
MMCMQEDGFPAVEDIKRDQEFWYPDGNIIVITDDQIAFRIYRGMLAEHSEVFRGMFTVPQPQSSERMDDCPIVHVSDASNDFRRILRFVFRGRNHYRDTDVLAFSEVAALIRIGHKYEVEGLVSMGRKRLRDVWPDSFEAWMARPAVKQEDRADCVVAVKLARLIGLDAILPAALYDCCQLETRTLLDGVSYPDGTVERLDIDDLTRCFDGRRGLSKAKAATLNAVFTIPADRLFKFGLLEKPEERCLDTTRCKNVLQELRNSTDLQAWHIRESALMSWPSAIKLDMSLTEVSSSHSTYLQLCAHCKRKVETNDKRERTEIWAKLPSIFDLIVEGRNTNQSRVVRKFYG